jgi:putative SOS response-associated peptidase YedK
MCYSAKARQEYRQYCREFGGTLSIEDYLRLFWERKEKGSPYRVPKAMEDAFLRDDSSEVAEIQLLIQEYRREEASRTEQELFAQTKRLNDAIRSLANKSTKKAENDKRIATGKIEKAKLKIADLRRSEPRDRDARIFPGNYSTVIASENGRRFVAPMRYQCRPAGKPSFNDTKFPGTYNARRDSLGSYWKGLFGYSHALMIVDSFYENVTGADGKNRVLQFTPKDGSRMLVACLWSRWVDPAGQAPDLLSFAAITDDPEPEVAAAGHDRTIINLKPEYVDSWLNPDPSRLEALHEIFEDKPHPYYEHREAA